MARNSSYESGKHGLITYQLCDGEELPTLYEPQFAYLSNGENNVQLKYWVPG